MKNEGDVDNITPTLIITDDNDENTNMEIEYNQTQTKNAHILFKLIGNVNQIKVNMIYKIGTPEEKPEDVTKKIKELSNLGKKISGARFHDEFLKGPQRFGNGMNIIRFEVLIDEKLQKIYTFIRSNPKRKNNQELQFESKKKKLDDSKSEKVSILPKVPIQNLIHSKLNIYQENSMKSFESHDLESTTLNLENSFQNNFSTSPNVDDYLDFLEFSDSPIEIQNNAQKIYFEPRYIFVDHPPNACHFRAPLGSNPIVKIQEKKIRATKLRNIENELEEFTISLDFVSFLYQGNSFQEFQIDICFHPESSLKTIEVTFMVLSNNTKLTPEQIKKIENVQTKDFESFLSENHLKKIRRMIHEKNSEEMILDNYLKSLKDVNLKKSMLDQIHQSNQSSPFFEIKKH
jgi:hypothetical protein